MLTLPRQQIKIASKMEGIVYLDTESTTLLLFLFCSISGGEQHISEFVSLLKKKVY